MPTFGWGYSSETAWMAFRSPSDQADGSSDMPAGMESETRVSHSSQPTAFPASRHLPCQRLPHFGHQRERHVQKDWAPRRVKEKRLPGSTLALTGQKGDSRCPNSRTKMLARRAMGWLFSGGLADGAGGGWAA